MDYRGKRVRFVKVSHEVMGEPHDELDLAHLGEVGTAESVFLDGRECHEESYLVNFPDGYVLNAVAEELELVEE